MIPQGVADIVTEWHNERLKLYSGEKESERTRTQWLVEKVYAQGVLDCAEAIKAEVKDWRVPFDAYDQDTQRYHVTSLLERSVTRLTGKDGE